MIGRKDPTPTGAGLLCGLLLALGPLLSPHAVADDVARKLDLEFESPLLAQRGDAVLSHLELDARMQKIPAEDRADVVHGLHDLHELRPDVPVDLPPLRTQAPRQEPLV